MIKIDETYSDYRIDNEEGYPGGKAVPASSPESVDGTPFKADWMNDINGFRQALYLRANGSLNSISNKPDTAQESDSLDAMLKINKELIDAAHYQILGGIGNDFMPIGTVISMAVPDSYPGYIAFDFNNAVEKIRYTYLWEAVGDMFLKQHIDAGDPLPEEGFFYPTPVPGKYNRSALSDITFDHMQVTSDSGALVIDNVLNYSNTAFRTGTPYRFKVISGTAPSGLVDGTLYYLRASSQINGRLFFYPSETNAIIAGYATAIPYNNSGNGTFVLTQSGLSMDDALQGHFHALTEGGGPIGLNKSDAVGGANIPNNTVTSSVSPVKQVISDTVNGIARISNETRPSSIILYNYIKSEKTHDTTPGEASLVGNIVETMLNDRELAKRRYLPLDGSIKRIEDYYNLVNVVYQGDEKNAAAQSFYKCDPDGVRNTAGSYFKLPDARGRVMRGAGTGDFIADKDGINTADKYDGKDVGDSIGDGIRNITGDMTGPDINDGVGIGNNATTMSGAFVKKSQWARYTFAGYVKEGFDIGLDISKSVPTATWNRDASLSARICIIY